MANDYTVQILLMPTAIRQTMLFRTQEEVQKLKPLLDRFQATPPISADITLMGEDLAEEMFDLTNNPYRQEEREKLYGRGRSISVGDVVRTPQGDFLCCSVGWLKM